MPRYTYDEPEDRQFTVLKPGEYEFVIAEVFAFEVSKESGNEYLPIKLNIKPEGVVYDNLVFTDKAKFRIDQLLKSIGKAPAPGTAVDFDDPTWLVGSKGRVKLKIDNYKGSERNKVDAYVFHPGRVSGRTVSAPSQSIAPSTPPNGIDDDDIPF